MWHLRTWFSRCGGVGLVVGLNDLRGLFQPMILWFYFAEALTSTAMQSIVRKAVLQSLVCPSHLICSFQFRMLFTLESLVRICSAVKYCQGHNNISKFAADLQGWWLAYVVAVPMYESWLSLCSCQHWTWISSAGWQNCVCLWLWRPRSTVCSRLPSLFPFCQRIWHPVVTKAFIFTAQSKLSCVWHMHFWICRGSAACYCCCSSLSERCFPAHHLNSTSPSLSMWGVFYQCSLCIRTSVNWGLSGAVRYRWSF